MSCQKKYTETFFLIYNQENNHMGRASTVEKRG